MQGKAETCTGKLASMDCKVHFITADGEECTFLHICAEARCLGEAMQQSFCNQDVMGRGVNDGSGIVTRAKLGGWEIKWSEHPFGRSLLKEPINCSDGNREKQRRQMISLPQAALVHESRRAPLVMILEVLDSQRRASMSRHLWPKPVCWSRSSKYPQETESKALAMC